MTDRALTLPLARADVAVAARTGVCAALIGAAVIHGTVVSEHYALWPLAGLFFLGTQLVEGALAIAAVYAWHRRTAQLVFVTSIATVFVWLVSRAFGMPFGPAAFRTPEAIGVPDLACCVLELGAALLAAPLAFSPRPRRRAQRAQVGRLGLVLAGSLAVLLLAVATWGLLPSISGTTVPHAHLHSGS
ncbi:MAG: hypothetical protein QOD98_1503 [Nocardioidaceae bacterium]|jgi:hypothetical protein|nr:hypothetical protein [Actinomycetota bacterium]MDX6372515.1 hypothetical protein [Nocardioidaceae bacterium]